jgi:gas vesicle protein
VRAAQVEALEQLAPLRVRQLGQDAPVEVEQVEDHERDRVRGRPSPDDGLRGLVHPLLEALEARATVGVERHDLAVEHGLARAERVHEAAQLGVLRGDVVQVAALDVEAPGTDVGDRAHAVPLDLVGPALVVAGQRAEARLHRHDALGHRLAAGVGRVHAVDHPVGLAPGAEQRVAAADALAVERDDDLAVAPGVALVRAGVPDRHRPRAVVALRDLAVELEVLERVVLGAHGLAVLVGVRRDPVRDRPRRERALVLEPQVPVQPPRVVLLDHEAPAGRRRGRVAGRLGRAGEVAHAAVLGELVGHAGIVPARARAHAPFAPRGGVCPQGRRVREPDSKRRRAGGPVDEQAGAGAEPSTGDRSPEEIRREIEQTREEMGDTVEALAQKADVKGQAHDRVEDVKESVREKVDEVRERVSGAAGQAAGAAPESAQEGAQQAAQYAQQGFQQATEATRRDPAKGLAAAFGAGLAVGWLVGRR